MKLMESTLVQNFILGAKAVGLLIDENDVKNLCQAYVASAADFLQLVKTKEGKVALTFDDLKGNFILGAVVEFTPNDEEAMPGNWNYYWTFNKEDIQDATIYQITSNNVATVIKKRAYDDSGAVFNSLEFISQLGIMFASQLSDFLDANAKEGEDFEIEHEGYFKASVSVENGEKIKSLIPDGAMKRLIKDDEAIEVE